MGTSRAGIQMDGENDGRTVGSMRVRIVDCEEEGREWNEWSREAQQNAANKIRRVFVPYVEEWIWLRRQARDTKELVTGGDSEMPGGDDHAQDG